MRTSVKLPTARVRSTARKCWRYASSSGPSVGSIFSSSPRIGCSGSQEKTGTKGSRAELEKWLGRCGVAVLGKPLANHPPQLGRQLGGGKGFSEKTHAALGLAKRSRVELGISRGNDNRERRFVVAQNLEFLAAAGVGHHQVEQHRGDFF